MRTVYRNEQGEITHVHYTTVYFLTRKDRDIVDRTDVTQEMLLEFMGNKIHSSIVLKDVINDKVNPKMLKAEILKHAGLLEHGLIHTTKL